MSHADDATGLPPDRPFAVVFIPWCAVCALMGEFSEDDTDRSVVPPI
jgi:hypothetical protein